ncbi:MAG: bifunctional adenosylcobinamide kinase/adenosylcobinamide-phosphate guanylyltransferase [Bacteroidota bacterium]
MPEASIHFITGGQRSGKSEYAERLALEQSTNPVYLATSKVWDEEYGKRIEVHQQRRSTNWETVEEEIELSQHDFSQRVVLLECITLWLTNIYTQQAFEQEASFAAACEEWDKLTRQHTSLIVVSNEIGLGTVPMDKGTRAFVDLQGKMNQRIANDASRVTFVVSGIPWQIK